MGSAGDSCVSLPPYAVIQPPETGAMAASSSGCTAAKLFVIIAPLEKPVIVVRHGSVPWSCRMRATRAERNEMSLGAAPLKSQLFHAYLPFVPTGLPPVGYATTQPCRSLTASQPDVALKSAPEETDGCSATTRGRRWSGENPGGRRTM